MHKYHPSSSIAFMFGSVCCSLDPVGFPILCGTLLYILKASQKPWDTKGKPQKKPFKVFTLSLMHNNPGGFSHSSVQKSQVFKVPTYDTELQMGVGKSICPAAPV